MYRTLNKDFQATYAKFWISLIRGNEKDLEKYARTLFNRDLDTAPFSYTRLFASIVSGRSWSAITKGELANGMRTAGELEIVAKKAGYILPTVSNILASIPRPMLLVLRTNDILRSIHESLGSRHFDVYQLGMACNRAVNGQPRSVFTMEYWNYSIQYVIVWFRLAIASFLLN